MLRSTLQTKRSEGGGREGERDRLPDTILCAVVAQDERNIQIAPRSEIFWFDLDRGCPLIAVFLEYTEGQNLIKLRQCHARSICH